MKMSPTETAHFITLFNEETNEWELRVKTIDGNKLLHTSKYSAALIPIQRQIEMYALTKVLEQIRQENGFYKKADLLKVAELFNLPTLWSQIKDLPNSYMFFFTRNPFGFQVFIRMGGESIELTAIH